MKPPYAALRPHVVAHAPAASAGAGHTAPCAWLAAACALLVLCAVAWRVPPEAVMRWQAGVKDGGGEREGNGDGNGNVIVEGGAAGAHACAAHWRSAAEESKGVMHDVQTYLLTYLPDRRKYAQVGARPGHGW